MTTESSTYTYEGGEQETVTLRHGTADPHGHALLKIDYSDGRTADCYVNTAWLRDRVNDLGEPRPLTPDAITDEMVERGRSAYWGPTYGLNVQERVRAILTAALIEPPARHEGDEPMTTDRFATAARAEAKRYWLETLRDGTVGIGDLGEHMAEWARARLATPARPEGAERWEDFLIDSLDYQALTDQQIADLADRIAEEMSR